MAIDSIYQDTKLVKVLAAQAREERVDSNDIADAM